MRGVVFTGDRRCEVREVPLPRPGHGEVLIRVRAAGICGSDLHVFRSSESSDQVRGHEACGDVVETGEGIQRLRLGDRVAVHHHQGCGVCYQCARGETVACSVRHRIIGVDVSGAFGEFVVAQESNCIPLAPTSTYVDGAFLACVGGTAYAALARLEVRAHQSVAVYGLGPLGLSCVLVARTLGLRAIGVDVVQLRVELARACGAEVVDASAVDPVDRVRQFGQDSTFGRGDGVDFVIETSGSPAARSNILPSLRREGRSAILGVPTVDATGLGDGDRVINPTHIHGRAATIVGSVVFPLAWMWDLARLCSVSGLSFERAVTHRFSLEDGIEALRVADGALGGKVVFVA